MTTSDSPDANRRGFLGLLAGGLWALLAAIPFVSGLVVFLNPLLRKRGEASSAVRVASLGQVPPDGIPRRFEVIADKTNVWNKTVDELGVVYLRRTSESQPPECLSAICPHLGCLVPFTDGKFSCPCHNSTFQPDGTRIDPAHSASPRNLDSMPVEVKNDEVWVAFSKFEIGTPEKKAIQ